MLYYWQHLRARWEVSLIDANVLPYNAIKPKWSKQFDNTMFHSNRDPYIERDGIDNIWGRWEVSLNDVSV